MPVDMPRSNPLGSPGGPHLDAERLASFDHDAPTSEELAHLAACAYCRAEREAFDALVTAAAAVASAPVDADAPRLASWDAIAAGLRREGMLTGQAPAVEAPRDRALGGAAPAPRRVVPVRSLLRYAAAVAALATSALLGRATAPAGVASEPGVTAPSASTPAFGVASGGAGYGSVAEATAALARAQAEYERASLWLAGNDSTARSSDVYRARLAALDQMMEASRAALRDAPQDPVLNHYYFAAYTAREATLQQLSSTLPVDKTIESY
jgi:hypothetical protein